MIRGRPDRSGTAAPDALLARQAALPDDTLADGGHRRAGVNGAASHAREAAAINRRTLLLALQQADAA